MENRKPFVLIMLVALFLSATIAGGCTGDSGPSPTAGETTNQQQEKTPGNEVTVHVTETAGKYLAEPVKLPGSITEDTAIRPKYDSQMEERILDEAKSEILRVFPGIDPSFLDNYQWSTNLAGSFFVPVIVFEGVIPDTNEPENILEEIAYDPDTGRIVRWYYTSDSPVNNKSGGELIEHKGVDIERDIIPMFKKMIGDEEYEENKDNYFIYSVDSNNLPITTIAYIRESRNNVRSYMGKTQINFNRANGEITSYGDHFNHEGFLKDTATLSPVPEISLDEAKSIIETKMDELYSDDPQEIEYSIEDDRTNCLYWLDRTQFLDIKDDYLLSPIPLAWGISYKTKESRNHGDRSVWAAVDANTGDILCLANYRIDIYGKNYG